MKLHPGWFLQLIWGSIGLFFKVDCEVALAISSRGRAPPRMRQVTGSSLKLSTHLCEIGFMKQWYWEKQSEKSSSLRVAQYLLCQVSRPAAAEKSLARYDRRVT